MKMTKLCFVWVGLLLLGVVMAQSFTETEFNVNGCTYNFGGEDYGLFAGRCSDEGGSAGYYYCEAGTPTTLWDTTEEGMGCSFGNADYELGDNFCCPSGMYCNKTESGLFQCTGRLVNCVDQISEEDCKDGGCVWMDITEECTDNPRSYDCSYYYDEASCLADSWGLGSSGVGTEACGSTIQCAGKAFIVPEDGCGCKWYPDAPLGDKCQLDIVVSETFYSDEPDKFECSNIYQLGNCTDGSMGVTWDSHSSIISGFESGFIPQECLDAAGCSGGESTRFCGEELIKLPGFSLFGFVMALSLISLYYFKHKEEFNL